MVVSLQSSASLALCDNDEGIENLVELAQIEQPAPESQSLVPQSAHIGRIWGTLWQQIDESVLGLPHCGRRVVCDCIAETAWTLHLAKRVCNACQSVGVIKARPHAIGGSCHSGESQARVDRQEDVMEDDKDLECARSCDPPRLVSMSLVVRIDQSDGDDVCAADVEWNTDVECAVVYVVRDGKRRLEAVLITRWWESWRKWVWWELEQVPVREGEVYRRARHGD